MVERGFLVPPWYHYVQLSPADAELCNVIWGATLCCAVFVGATTSHQTWVIHGRNKKFNVFLAMVWFEFISGVITSVMAWIFLKGFIMPKSILLNRASILAQNKRRTRQLKLATFFAIILVQISVFCVWIPAQLQISDRYIRFNAVWFRAEMAIFAIIDANLSVYILRVVQAKLVANELVKYRILFMYNIWRVCISVACDVHSLVHLIKLYIELSLAELIAKIVWAINPTDAALS
ncbi:uncharacterized protein PG998_012114 [Apiospora kogelbergensis]|uniref:uncharacterized protein n=1 Tax=Apiospora kogelbergensis TaxID=1337665 RepID=UPI0031308013